MHTLKPYAMLGALITFLLLSLSLLKHVNYPETDNEVCKKSTGKVNICSAIFCNILDKMT